MYHLVFRVFSVSFCVQFLQQAASLLFVFALFGLHGCNLARGCSSSLLCLASRTETFSAKAYFVAFSAVGFKG